MKKQKRGPIRLSDNQTAKPRPVNIREPITDQPRITVDDQSKEQWTETNHTEDMHPPIGQ